MITFACVLRSGGAYSWPWVDRLVRGVRRHLTVPHRFVCLTDAPEDADGIECEPLVHGWPGWWSKLELFRPGLFPGRTVYLDLDTIIVGSLGAIASHPHHFTAVEDYCHAGRLCSTALAWDGDFSAIWQRFAADPDRAMSDYRMGGPATWRPGTWGDQAFIEDCLRAEGIEWQTFGALWGPECIASYQMHARDRVPDGAAAVAFHGRPKPPEIRRGWVADAWRA